MNYPRVFNYPTTASTTRATRTISFFKKIYMDVNPNKQPLRRKRHNKCWACHRLSCRTPSESGNYANAVEKKLFNAERCDAGTELNRRGTNRRRVFEFTGRSDSSLATLRVKPRRWPCVKIPIKLQFSEIVRPTGPTGADSRATFESL